VIFPLAASGLQSELEAVALSVQMGVYCLVHIEVPAVRGPLQSRLGFMNASEDWLTPICFSIEAHVSPCVVLYVMTHTVRGPVASTELVRPEHNARAQSLTRVEVEKDNIVVP